MLLPVPATAAAATNNAAAAVSRNPRVVARVAAERRARALSPDVCLWRAIHAAGRTDGCKGEIDAE